MSEARIVVRDECPVCGEEPDAMGFHHVFACPGKLNVKAGEGTTEVPYVSLSDPRAALAAVLAQPGGRDALRELLTSERPLDAAWKTLRSTETYRSYARRYFPTPEHLSHRESAKATLTAAVDALPPGRDPADRGCPTCGGRGWHTAGGNDPTPCGTCPAGEAWNAGTDEDDPADRGDCEHGYLAAGGKDTCPACDADALDYLERLKADRWGDPADRGAGDDGRAGKGRTNG